MIDPLKHRFAALRSRAEFHSLRYVQRSGEYLSVRRNVSEPPHFSQDRGAMLCVRLNGVEAYAATNDLAPAPSNTTSSASSIPAPASPPTTAMTARPAVSAATMPASRAAPK